MCAPKEAPYSKSNMSCPDFSTGIASLSPCSRASEGMLPPNCSSTSTPIWSPGTSLRSTACTIPSKIRCFASAICAVCSGVGSPWIPNIFFWKDPRWSNARMYSLPS
jgi:hypothetical protein